MRLYSVYYICRQLYMFRVLTPVIRCSYNCVITASGIGHPGLLPPALVVELELNKSGWH